MESAHQHEANVQASVVQSFGVPCECSPPVSPSILGHDITGCDITAANTVNKVELKKYKKRG